MSDPETLRAYQRLALVPGLGPLTAARLLAAVDHPGEVFRLRMAQLTAIDGIGPERARRLCDPGLEETLERELARCRQLNVHLLTPPEAGYPEVFRRLPDPPLAIWLRGDLHERDRLAVAIVGPRRASAYGHRQATRFAGQLAHIGATIISGLARGVDTAAHCAALEVGGRTIAVLGSGLGKIYPPENEELAARICQGHGALISEFPLDMAPAPGHFPRRNRLVAALALGVLVVEADIRSGALITARQAGELGREVMALPGPIDRPEHAGANRLLRDGATLITSVDDVLEELQPLATLASAAEAPPPSLRQVNLSGRERTLFQLLSDEPRSVDDLVRVADLPASVVQATLISLELRRCARKQPGGYVRAG